MGYSSRVKKITKMGKGTYFIESFSSPLSYLISNLFVKAVLFVIKIVFFPITILVWLFKKK